MNTVRLALELARRNVTITEYFTAWVYAHTEYGDVSLAYLDYQRAQNRPNLATILRSKVDGSPACGITNVSPGAGAVGDSILLRGTNFSGVTSVQFNGVAATFTVNSANQITATVPASATTGPVTVIAAGGLAPGPVFSVHVPTVNPPTLTLRWTEQSVVLTWPTNAANYVLQTSTDLASGSWSNCPVAVVVISTNCATIVAHPAAAQFFRPIRP